MNVNGEVRTYCLLVLHKILFFSGHLQDVEHQTKNANGQCQLEIKQEANMGMKILLLVLHTNETTYSLNYFINRRTHQSWLRPSSSCFFQISTMQRHRNFSVYICFFLKNWLNGARPPYDVLPCINFVHVQQGEYYRKT